MCNFSSSRRFLHSDCSSLVLIVMMVSTRLLSRLVRTFHPAIPSHPVQVPSSDFKQVDTITLSMVEQVSLVRCHTRQDVNRLVEAVRLASVLAKVDTEGVEPLFYTLEEKNCPAREDVPNLLPGVKKKLLSLSVVVDEDYYVVPGRQ